MVFSFMLSSVVSRSQPAISLKFQAKTQDKPFIVGGFNLDYVLIPWKTYNQKPDQHLLQENKDILNRYNDTGELHNIIVTSRGLTDIKKHLLPWLKDVPIDGLVTSKGLTCF